MGSPHRSVLVLAIAIACSACARGAGTDVQARGGSPDPIRRRDAAVSTDAGPHVDASVADAAPPDSGRPDAGPVDARVCAAETCNGLDDDCDGVIDDGAACPCEARVISGRSYLFCDDPRTWIEARATCTGAGYDLVTIDDASEDAAIYREIAARDWDDTWIGLSDTAVEDTWRWADGDPLAYQHWDAGEPNDGGEGGEDCGVIMTARDRESEWDDRPCSNDRSYVCEAH